MTSRRNSKTEVSKEMDDNKGKEGKKKDKVTMNLLSDKLDLVLQELSSMRADIDGLKQSMEKKADKEEVYVLDSCVKTIEDMLPTITSNLRQLEIKTNILEQRSRKNNVIISDLDLRSYAETVSEDSEESVRKNFVADEVKIAGVIQFAADLLDHEIQPASICDVYTS